METYNFWQDFFDTYQSLPDWLKALWLIVPPAFLLGLVAIVVRPQVECPRTDDGFPGKLIYTVVRDGDHFHIISHDTQIGGQPRLLLPDSQDSFGQLEGKDHMRIS